MPEALERKLKGKAKKKFSGDKGRQDAYTYGGLRSTGWRPYGPTGHTDNPERKKKG